MVQGVGCIVQGVGCRVQGVGGGVFTWLFMLTCTRIPSCSADAISHARCPWCRGGGSGVKISTSEKTSTLEEIQGS